MGARPRARRWRCATSCCRCRRRSGVGGLAPVAPTAAATSANPAQRGASTGQPDLAGAIGHGAAVGDRQLQRTRHCPPALGNGGGELSSTLSFDPGRRRVDRQSRQVVRRTRSTPSARPTTCAAPSAARRRRRRTRRRRNAADPVPPVVIYIDAGHPCESLIHPSTFHHPAQRRLWRRAETLLLLKWSFPSWR